jgi:CarboxypepD_reg-like domain/Secretion system C-terminal sorting domain
MSKNIQLTIADPCHENWDQMTTAEQGRYCASCQKQVMDFTSMSDSQLAAFFKKPTSGSVCGRFYQDQLERDIGIQRKRIPWVKYFFQFALPAFLVSMKVTAQGKVKIAGDTTVVIDKKEKRIPGNVVPKCELKQLDKISIIGKVIDEDNNLIPFATIMLKNTKYGISAHDDGTFRIENFSSQDEIVLQVSSVGYEAKEIPISKETDLTKDLVIQLTRQVLGEVVVVAYPHVKGRVVVGGVMSKKVEEMILDTTSIIKPPTETAPMIKVYPNPVISGTNINVACQKLKEGYYSVQLSNQSGQQVFNKQTWIDAEAQVLNIDIPTVAAGVYFLKLTNKETNKRFTEKIIVQ